MKQFIAVLFLIFTCLRMVDAGGLVLYTTRGSSYVSAVQYETFSSPSAHLSYVTMKGGNRLQIQTAGIVAQIPFPDSSVTVGSEDAEAAISQAEIYAARYPQYAKLLQSVGELWKRKLEAIKLAQAQPTPSASVSQNTGPKTSLEGATSEIPVVRTRSGQTLKNVRITRFEDDKAVITHDGGIGRLLISDIADTSAFPGDVKAAIEKAQAAMVAVNKAEADRVAAEKRENETILKQKEEDQIRLAAQQEKERTSKESGENRQEQTEESQPQNSTVSSALETPFTLSIAAKPAADFSSNTSSEPERSEKRPNEQQPAEETQANKTVDDQVDQILNSPIHFTINPRGPEIHGFRLGMLYTDFVERVRAVADSEVHIRPGGTRDVTDLANSDNNDRQTNVIVNYLRFTEANGVPLATVAVAGKPSVVIDFYLHTKIVNSLFKVRDLSYDDICQRMIDAYNVPKLNGFSQDGVHSMGYKGPNGWSIFFNGGNFHSFEVNLVATPMEKERGFGR